MTTSEDWKPPAGMLPRFNYPDGVTPVVEEGYARLVLPGETLSFVVGKEHKTSPELPLQQFGKLWMTGWDIPIRWAVDAAGSAFKSGGHGGCLNKCNPEDLVAEAEKEEDKNDLRRLLGITVPPPEWTVDATRAGWSPPPAEGKQYRIGEAHLVRKDGMSIRVWWDDDLGWMWRTHPVNYLDMVPGPKVVSGGEPTFTKSMMVANEWADRILPLATRLELGFM